MEATDEPFTMSYELMLHSSDAVHSLPGNAQHHNSSAPEPIITALPIHSATPTTPEGVVTAFMQPYSFR